MTKRKSEVSAGDVWRATWKWSRNLLIPTTALGLLIACGPSSETQETNVSEAPATPAVAPAPVPEPAPPVPVETSEAQSKPSETQADAEPGGEQGVIPWVEGAVGTLVRGLDGGKYQAYDPAVVRDVQEELTNRGQYNGPVDGALDAETMDAIAAFQRENNLSASGIPSPRTREQLFDDVPADAT